MSSDLYEKYENRAVSIIRQYVPQIDEKKIKDYFQRLNDNSSSEIRYIMFEDHNVSSQGPENCEEDYLGGYWDDMDLVEIWRMDGANCGMAPDELDEASDGYQGLIDLVEGKYLRVNGHGQIYEFGDPNAPDGTIDWSMWFRK
jgi:hypothetical protein